MRYHHITDWDDAYANADHSAGASEIMKSWPKQASAFRKQLSKQGRVQLDIRYGNKPRNLIDIFLPEKDIKGLLVFIHGGYWYRFTKDDFSHLSEGALAHGWAVAMPSYSLCPDIKISGITKEVGKAISHAAKLVKGPIRIAGHSAGGHLAARMISTISPLFGAVHNRVEHTMAISPVADLRPLCHLKLNKTLKLTDKEAAAESPALLTPMPNTHVTCWVGAGERSEFIRQNALLANIWHGLGARITEVREPDKHHFNVVEGLADKDSEMVGQLLS